MDLSTFIKLYDQPGKVILLEGKRNVRPEDAPMLIALGKLLATNSHFMVFRSGNAAGSDALFASGVVAVDPRRLQVILPYTGHRKAYNQAGSSLALDTINLTEEPQIVYESRLHKGTASLIDRYVAGTRNAYTIKASYILRDTVKVLGAAELPKAAFACFYDDPDAPRQGGTGHTMAVCERNDVPFVDQRIWTQWLP
jgi:hypothetical protein